MRDLNLLNAYRLVGDDIVALFGSIGDHGCGAFVVPSPRTGATLRVIASAGEGWDHVSVSLENRCPNWIEMDHVKRLFFRDDETAMQLHVPPAEHVNHHPRTLHLWRPQHVAIPRPPNWMVGAPDVAVGG